ncbi:AAA family ATPase [Streptomyces millisiae]|uniref:AAA family ATPase n=1 Tax=Streptomyces millisiae TaxID=3075542 RepID=A0ABU2LQA4_9ACTN|nr:AAA family ATPase [Streptomyces sp. DSM 44918]MDT0319777.1 AAA family ATPase [Streptomyces sp. DSM 44918]
MFTGRKKHLDVLLSSLTQAQSGSGQVALVTGCLASGKSALLQQFSEKADSSGAIVFNATGSRTERDLPMGVVWQLLHSTPIPSKVIRRFSRFSRAETAGRSEEDSPSGGLRRGEVLALNSLFSSLLILARSRPAVIIVDDLHFADNASLQALLFLRHRLRSSRVLVVLSSWDRPGYVGPAVQMELMRQAHHRIRLGRLSTEEITELVLDAGHRDPSSAADLAAGLGVLSGGNPLLVRALLDDSPLGVDEGPGPAGRPVAGEAFQRAVLDCLHRWDPALMEVARGLAVLDDHAAPELIARLLPMQPDTVPQLLAVLEKAGLLHQGRLGSPEIAAVVRGTLSGEETTRLYSRAAELLYEHGAMARDVARRLLRADTVPGPWALRALRQAAEQTLAENDVDSAVRGLELGLRECGQGPEALKFRAALVRVAWRVNPSAAARHISPLYDALNLGQLSARDAAPLIRHLLWQGDRATATRLLWSITSSPEAGRTAGLAELRIAHEWIYGAPCEPPAAEPTAPSDRSRARRPAAGPQPRGSATLSTLWRQGMSEALLNGVEHILQGRLGDTIPEAGAMALLVLHHSGHRKRAEYWHGVLSAEAARLDAPTWQAVLASVGADMAMRRGDLARAAALARDALSRLHAQSWGAAIGFPLSTLILAETAMGRYEEASKLLDLVVPEAVFDTVAGLQYLYARGHYNLAVDRVLAAAGDFERCGALMREWDVDFPALVPWRSSLAQANLRLGRSRETAELIAQQLDLLGPSEYARTRGVSLRVLAAASPLKERCALLQEAALLLEQSEDRLELARTLNDISQVYQTLGDLGRARLVARRATQEAKACNTDVVTPLQALRVPKHVIRSQSEPPAHQTDGLVALSEAERKVATLAAYGHTNREIGRKLYITVSTVEQHLTRVYRKLNVRQRTDLPSELTRYASDIRP